MAHLVRVRYPGGGGLTAEGRTGFWNPRVLRCFRCLIAPPDYNLSCGEAPSENSTARRSAPPNVIGSVANTRQRDVQHDRSNDERPATSWRGARQALLHAAPPCPPPGVGRADFVQ